MILSMLKGFHFSSLYTFYFVFFYKLKIYISRRRLKDDLRMMVYSAHAAHHQGLLVFVVEIATVGKDSLGQQFLYIILMFQRESSITVSLSNVRFMNSHFDKVCLHAASYAYFKSWAVFHSSEWCSFFGH